jgi:hypothetical protein
MPASPSTKTSTKEPMCPCAIMDVLVQYRHESLKKTGLDESIGTHGDRLKTRLGQSRVSSNLAFGTSNFRI